MSIGVLDVFESVVSENIGNVMFISKEIVAFFFFFYISEFLNELLLVLLREERVLKGMTLSRFCSCYLFEIWTK